MTREKLQEIIAAHGRWLKDEPDGERADLRGANLCDADLCGADLCGADLCGANLCGAKILQIGPIGSRKAYTIFRVNEDIVQCGCWNDYKGGSLDDFAERVRAQYPDENNPYRKEYERAIDYFRAEREAWIDTNKEEGKEA